MSRLRLIAGPNGSGKTTLTNHLREVYEVPMGQYVNPDEIELNLLDYESDPVNRSRLAQKISIGQRSQWLQQGISHSYESVMSHPSHLDYIRDANRLGYRTYLYYVCISDPDMNVERVDERVKLGGHPVPEDKVRKRHNRSLGQLFDMAQLCYRTYFFDNTDVLTPFAEVNPNGYLDVSQADYDRVKPLWFRNSVLLRWDRNKIRVVRGT